MRKFTLVISALLFISAISFSQNYKGKFSKAPSFSHQFTLGSKSVKATTQCDTVMPASYITGTCPDSLSMYYACGYCTTQDSGFITGSNAWKFQADGVKYKGVAGATVSNVIVFYAYKIGTTPTTSCKIYAASNGLPTGTALGTSATKAISKIDTTDWGVNFNNVYTFSTAVSVASDFVVTITFPTFNATTSCVGIFQQGFTQCGALDTAGSFEVGNKWYAFSDATNGFGANVDAAIFPVICVPTTEVENYTPVDVITLYPNPSNGIVNVLSSNNIESIKIMNAIGQTVFENKVSANYTQLNTSDLNSGIYFVQIKCKNGITTKSLQVVK